MKRKKKNKDQEFINAVKSSRSIAETLRKLKLDDSGGGNYRTFYKKKKELHLNTDHFTGQAHLKGKKHNWSPKVPLKDILIEDSTYTNTSNLKKRLFDAKLLENKCSQCELINWKNKSISLHLDHINGIYNDNRLENLRILCPNCHSQTDTFAGKNIGTYCKYVKQIHQCSDCQAPISRNAKRCRSCAGRHRENTKISWPTKTELSKMVAESNYSAMSRKLGVSDNAIRKRLRNH